MTTGVALFGLSLVVGGSYAYFSNTKTTDSIISNGTLDLGLDKDTIIQIENMAPGDMVEGDIEISNNGNIDMGEVLLHSSYEVIDNGTPNNGDDLGEHIHVEVIHQGNEENTVIFEKRLSQLTESPERIMDDFPTDDEAATLIINFTFVDNGEDQNHFQADEMQIKWDFEGVQRDGDASTSSSGTYAFFSDQSSAKGEFAFGEWQKDQTEEQQRQESTEEAEEVNNPNPVNPLKSEENQVDEEQEESKPMNEQETEEVDAGNEAETMKEKSNENEEAEEN